MCLAVFPDYQIETLKRPLIVYKRCRIGDGTDIVSAVRYKVYKSGELEICPEPFRLCTKLAECLFSDLNEERVVRETIGCLSIAWHSHKLQMIKTGFHFYFTIERALNSPIYYGFDVVTPFLIPTGSQIIRGIDKNLGVCNQIMRL